MILLKTIKDEDVLPNCVSEKDIAFRKREAARAVVFDSKGKVGLLYVSKYNYHKLPGGGVEENENIQKALEREMMEEIGCKTEVKEEVGEIIEYRNQHKLMQTNYIYLAQVKGDKGKPSFTDEEIADGFEVKWLTLPEAINALENDVTNDYQGGFVKIRDLTALYAVNKKEY